MHVTLNCNNVSAVVAFNSEVHNLLDTPHKHHTSMQWSRLFLIEISPSDQHIRCNN